MSGAKNMIILLYKNIDESVRLMKVDSQFPVTLLHLKTNSNQTFHYFE